MIAATDTHELKIVRTFAASAEQVFSMWTEPEHFSAWVGPEGYTCPSVEMDARVGGTYRALIRSPENGDNWFGGTFRQIVPHTRLVMTFVWDNDGPSAGIETVITLTFEEKDGQTIQTFRQAPFRDGERRDSHKGGWTSAFQKLDQYVSKLSSKEQPR